MKVEMKRVTAGAEDYFGVRRRRRKLNSDVMS